MQSNTFQLETTLNGNISATATTITLADASAFPTSGFIVIGDETIEYTGKSSDNQLVALEAHPHQHMVEHIQIRHIVT